MSARVNAGRPDGAPSAAVPTPPLDDLRVGGTTSDQKRLETKTHTFSLTFTLIQTQIEAQTSGEWVGRPRRNHSDVNYRRLRSARLGLNGLLYFH